MTPQAINEVVEKMRGKRPEYLAEISRLKALKDEEHEWKKKCAINAMMGGVHRRWKQLLLIELTKAIFQSSAVRTSRKSIAKWQKDIIGFSVKERELKPFAKCKIGDGRPELDKITDDMGEVLRLVYFLYEDELHMNFLSKDEPKFSENFPPDVRSVIEKMYLSTNQERKLREKGFEISLGLSPRPQRSTL